jgi:hypothetical protein
MIFSYIFWLFASIANVLTKGSILTENLIMQCVWAWTQCIAIEASVAGAIIGMSITLEVAEKFRGYLAERNQRACFILLGLVDALTSKLNTLLVSYHDHLPSRVIMQKYTIYKYRNHS